MQTFPLHFTGIKGLRPHLPRLGKIRLGVKAPTSTGKSRPVETNTFVLDDTRGDLKRVFGDSPTTLTDVYFPTEDLTRVFDCSLKWYGAGGVRCKGNNEQATRRWADCDPDQRAAIGGSHPPNTQVTVPCPCPRLQTKECSLKAHLMLSIPKVNAAGVYQIDTGSIHNATRILGVLVHLRNTVGRISGIPVTIRREACDISCEGTKKTHYLLQIEWDGSPEAIARYKALPPPIPFDVAVPEDTLAPVSPDAFIQRTPAPSNGATGSTPAADTVSNVPAMGERPATTGTPLPEPAAPVPTPAPDTVGAPDETPASAPDSVPAPAGAAPQAEAADASQSPAPVTQGESPLHCKACGSRVSQRIAEYSRRFFAGATLCMACQKQRGQPRRAA
jgi:hypothetical protein